MSLNWYEEMKKKSESVIQNVIGKTIKEIKHIEEKPYHPERFQIIFTDETSIFIDYWDSSGEAGICLNKE